MRIVTANNYYYLRGGSERVLFDEERTLRGLGHEVIPFSAQHEKNYPTAHAEFFAPKRGADSASVLTKIGAIPAFVNNRQAASQFGRLLDAVQPGIVHCHNIYASLTTSILVEARERGVPSVMTAHDAKLICPTYLCLDHGKICEACGGKNFYEAVVKNCHAQGMVASSMFALESYYNAWHRRYEMLSRIIAPSRFLKELLVRNGVAEGSVTFIPNGVDVSGMEASVEPGEYVLYVGRLSAEKGVLTLIRAMEGLKIPLRIVGEGPVGEAARVLAAGNRQVTFEGYRQGAELAELYREAAFVVTPSEWYENAPMSVLEAFAYGKPVLGAAIGGIPEMVRAGQTGELFESKSVEGLREQLQQMYGDRAGLRRRGENARACAATEYSLELHAERLVALYETCVDAGVRQTAGR